MLFLLLEAKEVERDVDDDKEEEEGEEEEVVGLNCPLIKVPVVLMIYNKY